MDTRRTRLVALVTVLAILVLAIGVCEATGWPFLVAPVQHRLAELLDRRIVLGGDPASPVRIGLIGGVRVRAGSIEIGAPDWSDAPYLLLARDARLTLSYRDLWRAYRGGTLNIRELEAATLDARLSRLDDGRASWQLGSKRAPEDGNEAACPPSAASPSATAMCSTPTRSSWPTSTRVSRSATATRARQARAACA